MVRPERPERGVVESHAVAKGRLLGKQDSVSGTLHGRQDVADAYLDKLTSNELKSMARNSPLRMNPRTLSGLIP